MGREPGKLAVLVVVVAACSSAAMTAGAVQRRTALDEIAESDDVTWLEEIAASAEASRRQDAPGGLRGKPKLLRTLAYARLGELATEESLEAVRRIEARARSVVPAPEHVSLGVWTHPSWHFGDTSVAPLAQAVTRDGVGYGVVLGSLMGSLDLFLISNATPADASTWTRPKLIPERYYRGLRDPELVFDDEGRLRLSFFQDRPPGRAIMEGTREPGTESPVLGPQEWELDIADIERDSDGDGWTDIEETRLGLDRRMADSDGDGIADGRDITPNFAPTPESSEGERAQILQRAVFATFGLSGARHLLLVQRDQPPLDVWGYGGPVLYGVDRAGWAEQHEFGAIWVQWQIESIGVDRATVLIADHEGPLAAGGQYVELAKIGNEWFVVGWRPGAVA